MFHSGYHGNGVLYLHWYTVKNSMYDDNCHDDNINFTDNYKYSDIDECANGTDNCDAHAECTNTLGNFTCACQSGYQGNGVTCNGINCY